MSKKYNQKGNNMRTGKANIIKEHTAMLFGEKTKLLEGIRTKRMHVYVDEKSDEKVRSEAKALGISISDYVLYAALFFKTDDISEKLDLTIYKLNRLNLSSLKSITTHLTKNTVKKIIKQYKEGSNFMTNENNIEQKKKGKTGQFHLRVTPEAYEEIKKRAAAFSMSISDYVVFTTVHFDVMEISKKIDEINTKIDLIAAITGE